MRTPPKTETPDYVVYRVQNQFKYFDDDENPVIIKAGLYEWEARQLIRELNWAPISRLPRLVIRKYCISFAGNLVGIKSSKREMSLICLRGRVYDVRYCWR